MSTLGKIIAVQKELLELLITCESEVAHLYETYSRCIPERSTFWSSLAKEERKHAALLEESRSQLENDEIFSGLGKVNTEAASKMIGYIKERQLEAEEEAPPESYAASVALEIESSIIDSHVFNSIQPKAQDFQKVASRLASDTHDHILLVQEEKLTAERIRRRNGMPSTALPPPLSGSLPT